MHPGYSYDDDTGMDADDTPPGLSPILVVVTTLGGLVGLATCIITCMVRKRVRERDNIPATCCAPCDDILLSCCCMCCVQAQLMRHEGLTYGRYHLTTPTGAAPTML